LSPPLTRSPRDLWRLDTSEKYVRGEEALGRWKPRGLSVVQDYERLVSTERRAADVQAIRVLLTTTPPRPINTETLAWKADELLKKSVELWQKQFGHRGEIILSQDPTESDESKPRKTAGIIVDEGLKLISETN
jgi:kinesin family protein 1